MELLSVGECLEWPVSCALAESRGSALCAGNVNGGSESRGVGDKQASCGIIISRRLAQGGAERILDATPAAALRHQKGLRWKEGAACFPLFFLHLRCLLRLLPSSSGETTGLEATTASREAALATHVDQRRFQTGRFVSALPKSELQQTWDQTLRGERKCRRRQVTAEQNFLRM